ncbi:MULTISPECIES: helix-turn-helix domain-containing protein [unclassified Streptomyces]|uniref:helix-turn-helix domain-containing protein n=1 Tax=unclassified Streptomyces TaxID=2593676 RepID=UPI0016609952|nr:MULTISPECIES: helix-turn-helix domain-containing protein [unclassified Streptomyces]MBD0707148.1 AraC family transcriptional regulator [Streptomyces sp. CBMA291]MBD0713636.1 AraC family transcriptional regulator [Streptomyces sp. CBMA370]
MSETTALTGTPCAAPRDGDPPMHRLEMRMPGGVPFAAGTFDTIGPMSRAAFPHRHTFYEIVHVTEGTGTHVVDFTRWELSPPHLGLILPGQLHHWENARGLDGNVVLFTEDFLLDHPGDRDLLRRLGERPWLTLDGPAHARTGRLMAELVEEYGHGADGFATVLRSLLHVLLVRTARLRGPGAGGPPPGRNAAVADAFARLLARDGGADGRPVRAYAELLGVTPGYLTESVRAATGRTPGTLLREARTREAQRLLARTELSVRQIAARTGFSDPAYFCRFFRRETGTSPGDFRKHHDHRAPSIEGGRSRA